MVAAALFSWWYGAGWRLVRQNVRERIRKVSNSFSVPSLLKTLFSPWRRIYTESGANISEQLKAFEDNLISRFVGFGVRCIVLLTAGLMIGAIAVFGLIQIILWPLIPPLIIVLLVRGFV